MIRRNSRHLNRKAAQSGNSIFIAPNYCQLEFLPEGIEAIVRPRQRAR